MIDYIEIERSIENFVSDNLEKYYLNDEYVGVNCDYILTLNYDNEKIFVEKVDIYQNFKQEQEFIYSFFNLSIADNINTGELYDFISKSNLLKVSNDLTDEYGVNDSYDYCISLDGRYLPKIWLDIKGNLEDFLNNIKSNEILLENGYYYNKNRLELTKRYHLNNKIYDFRKFIFKYAEKRKRNYSLFLDLASHTAFNKYLNNRYKLIGNICAYLLYWIRAYDISMQIRGSRKSSTVISFSHRYIGWSQPIFDFKDLKIHFKTNFGYGNSSYFYVMLEYKDIKIVSFMDWIVYPYFEANQVLQYTKKLHTTRNRVCYIENDFWFNAMNFICEAVNIYIKDEKKFIEKYIVNQLDEMIDGLYNILDMDRDILNQQYGNIKHFKKINTEKFFNVVGNAEDLCVKSSKICGALGFIGKIIELSGIVDSSNYINKLEQCNIKILPLLENSIMEINNSLSNLNPEFNDIKKQVDYIYGDNKNPMNLKFLREQKLKLTPKEFQEKYPNFQEIENNYKELFDRYSILSNDIKNIKVLQKNIEKYIDTVNQYFLNSSKKRII